MQIYVLKQAWSPYNVVPSDPEKFIATPSEAGLYARLLQYKDAEKHTIKIFSAHNVSIRGCPDSTLESIRRGLKFYNIGLTDTPANAEPWSLFSEPDEAENNPRRSKPMHRTSVDRDEAQESFLLTRCTDMTRPFGAKDRPIVSRVLSRSITETWGWPLEYFIDNLELLCVMRDLISGTHTL